MPSSFLALVLAQAVATAPIQDANPNLDAHGRRAAVLEEARDIAQELEFQGRRMPPGFYVAFDRDPRIAYATAACDDDGDYVVVFSDALLVTLSYLAHGADERESFTNAVKRSPRAARVPVPARMPSIPLPDTAHAYAVYTEIIHILLRREMVPLATKSAVDIPERYRCAHPTETHESGDEEWTRDEARQAVARGGLTHRHPDARTIPAYFHAFLSECADSASFAEFATWNDAPQRPRP